MSSILKSKCKQLGCLIPSSHKGYCTKHSEMGTTPLVHKHSQHEHSHLYKKARWAQVRRNALFRTPLCQRCKCYGVVREGNNVDHVIPARLAPELFFNSSNHQVLCHSCHSIKTGREQRGELWDFRGATPAKVDPCLLYTSPSPRD